MNEERKNRDMGFGSIVVLVVMGMNPFIATQEFSKISIMTTVIGAIINIILDPIFNGKEKDPSLSI